MTPAERHQTEGLDLNKLRVGLTITVAIGVSVGVIVALATGGQKVLAGILALPFGWLALALVLSGLSWLGQGLGFAALTTRGVRGHLTRMTLAFLGGDFAALVTPFGSGGIPAGVYCLTREGLSTGESSAIIAMHSMLTGAFFLVVGAFAAVVMPLQTRGSQVIVWSGIGAIAIVLALVVVLAARPKTAAAWLDRTLARPWLARLIGPERASRLAETARREANRFAEDVHTLTRERPSQLALSFFGLFMSRVCLVVCLPVIMLGLGWRGDILPLMATAVGAMALAIVSPTPGGSGAVEAATAALLATQAPAAMAGAATLLWRGVTYYTEVVAGWLVFTRYLGLDTRSAEKTASTSDTAS
jgi:uncharacterized protein (TIRG00374 family)